MEENSEVIKKTGSKMWEHFKKRAFSNAEKSDHTVNAGSVKQW